MKKIQFFRTAYSPDKEGGNDYTYLTGNGDVSGGIYVPIGEIEKITKEAFRAGAEDFHCQISDRKGKAYGFEAWYEKFINVSS